MPTSRRSAATQPIRIVSPRLSFSNAAKPLDVAFPFVLVSDGLFAGPVSFLVGGPTQRRRHIGLRKRIVCGIRSFRWVLIRLVRQVRIAVGLCSRSDVDQRHHVRRFGAGSTRNRGKCDRRGLFLRNNFHGGVRLRVFSLSSRPAVWGGVFEDVRKYPPWFVAGRNRLSPLGRRIVIQGFVPDLQGFGGVFLGIPLAQLFPFPHTLNAPHRWNLR